MNKSDLKTIAEETIQILETGNYTHYVENEDGEVVPVIVEIAELIQESMNKTILYHPTDNLNIPNHSDKTASYDTQFQVLNCTTIEAAYSLGTQCNLEDGEEVMVLNFASAKNPGGGFLRGAQEESLARSSSLYKNLIQEKCAAYYAANQNDKTCLYTDHIIFSPSVPFFRMDNGDLLEHPHQLTVITAPAPNAKIAAERIKNTEQIQKIHYTRADKVLAIARLHNLKYLVLGSWGTGVFGGSIEFVAKMFKNLLTTKYQNCFKLVVFAIRDKATFDTFDYHWNHSRGTSVFSAPVASTSSHKNSSHQAKKSDPNSNTKGNRKQKRLMKGTSFEEEL